MLQDFRPRQEILASSRGCIRKFPQGWDRLFGIDIHSATVGYEHLVKTRSQCWSLHPGGLTGVVKIDTVNLFMNISMGSDILGKRVKPPDPGKIQPCVQYVRPIQNLLLTLG